MRILVLTFTAAVALTSCGGSPEPTQPAQPVSPPAAASASPAQPPAVKAGWVVQNMRTPESVYLDEGSGYLYVSQINGTPTDRDGNGRISKLGLDGSVVSADWFTGLNAPKGLRSFGGTLWVADLDEVIGIDIASAKENARIKVDGAKFLNDVAVAVVRTRHRAPIASLPRVAGGGSRRAGSVGSGPGDSRRR